MNAAVSPITPTKYKRDTVSETESKRRRYKVGISGINLNIDEGVEEIKKETQEE